MPDGREHEFHFLLTSCLGGPRAVPEPDASFDWKSLRALSARHRVDGMMWQALDRPGHYGAPERILADLDRARRAQSYAHLAQLAETLRLSELLEAHACPVIALKGVTLANQLYAPNPELRQSQDIDLLVDPGHFANAGALLTGQGYERRTPAADMPQSADSMARRLTNAYEFYHPASGIKVELHHRLLLDPTLMAAPFAELLARASRVPIGNGSVRCLGPADLGVYLCCHAAEDAFFRLKWLADLARLFDRIGAEGTAGMLGDARKAGADRHVALALLMLERHSGRPAPRIDQPLRHALQPLVEGATRALLRSDRGGARFGFADVPDDLRLLAYGVRLSRAWSSRRFKLLRHLCNHEDMSALKLGVEWRLLYALLGRPLALRRWLGRAVARRSRDQE